MRVSRKLLAQPFVSLVLISSHLRDAFVHKIKKHSSTKATIIASSNYKERKHYQIYRRNHKSKYEIILVNPDAPEHWPLQFQFVLIMQSSILFSSIIMAFRSLAFFSATALADVFEGIDKDVMTGCTEQYGIPSSLVSDCENNTNDCYKLAYQHYRGLLENECVNQVKDGAFTSQLSSDQLIISPGYHLYTGKWFDGFSYTVPIQSTSCDFYQRIEKLFRTGQCGNQATLQAVFCLDYNAYGPESLALRQAIQDGIMTAHIDNLIMVGEHCEDWNNSLESLPWGEVNRDYSNNTPLIYTTWTLETMRNANVPPPRVSDLDGWDAGYTTPLAYEEKEYIEEANKRNGPASNRGDDPFMSIIFCIPGYCEIETDQTKFDLLRKRYLTGLDSNRMLFV